MNRRLLFPFVLVFLLVSAAISFAQQAENVERVGRALYSAAHCVSVQGNYAYVGTYGSLLVFDVSNPLTPFLVGHVYTKDTFRGLWVSGGYAYAAQEKYGLNIYDVSDPHNPRHIAHRDTELFAQGLFLSDTLAFVAQAQNGFLIFDVSDPPHPELLSSYDTPCYVWRFFVSDTLLYVADNDCGLRIMSINDPAHPREVGFFDVEDVPNKIYAQNLWICDTLAYVGSGDGLWIIDVVNPSEPKLVSFTWMDHYVNDVTVSDEIAFLAADEVGLLVLDVSDPYHPQQVAIYDTHGRSFNLTMVDTLVYVADNWGGLLIFKVEDPSNPVLLSSYVTGHSVENIYVTGGYAYVAEDYAGLRILDVNDPSHPVVVGSFGAGELICDVQVQGRYAYLADNWVGLRIVDISDPTRPEQVGVCEIEAIAISDVFVNDSLAFVVALIGGLYIITVSDPKAPRQIGHFNNYTTTGDVYAQDTLAYLADSEGLRIISVADPGNPWQVGMFESRGEASVFVAGTSAYIVGGGSHDYYNFRIVDVSDPTHPVQKGYCCNDQTGFSTYICDSLAYVADWDFGLQVVCINHPPMLDRIGYYKTDSFVLSTFCADGYAYLGGAEGLYIFQYQPQVGISDNLVDIDPTPNVYALNQNYPNPFNPITTIRYTIPSTEQRAKSGGMGADTGPYDLRTTLKIYNILGQEVRTLVDGPQEAGYYSVTWDGRDDSGREVASGVYLCRLKAGDFVQTKKMTLVR